LEVAEIVRNRNPDLPPDVCQLLASYGGRVPREALDFAKAVKKAAFRMQSRDWRLVCKVVGERKGIDEEGFTRQHMSVLVALFNAGVNGMSIKRLADQVTIAECDLEEYVLPFLQIQTSDRQPLVSTSSRGLAITADGKQTLLRKGLLKKKGS
jgi:hypothetical protein